MTRLERMGMNRETQRRLFLLELEDASELPGRLTLPSRHFLCLLAWNSERESVETIDRVTRIIKDAGCAYFCAWGQGCGRVHDVFDEQCLDEPDTDSDTVLLTTWHDDPLDDALWFFLNAVEPQGRYADRCTSALVVVIGKDADFTPRIRYALEHPARFSDEILNRE